MESTRSDDQPVQHIVGIFNGSGINPAHHHGVLPRLFDELNAREDVRALQYNGVGEYDLRSRDRTFFSRVRKTAQYITGRDNQEIMDDGMRDIEDHIRTAKENGKRPVISLFGFSRGGAAALVIANRLAHAYRDEDLEVHLHMVDPVPGLDYSDPQYHTLSPHLASVMNLLSLSDTRSQFQPLHTGVMNLPGPASNWQDKIVEVGFPCSHSRITDAKKSAPPELFPIREITEAMFKHSLRAKGIPVEPSLDRGRMAEQFTELRDPRTEQSRLEGTIDKKRLLGGTSHGTRNAVQKYGERVPEEGIAFNPLEASVNPEVRLSNVDERLVDLLQRYRPSRDNGHLSNNRIQQRDEFLREAREVDVGIRQQNIFRKYCDFHEAEVKALHSIVRDYLYDSKFAPQSDMVSLTEKQAESLGALQILEVDLQYAGSAPDALLARITGFLQEGSSGEFDDDDFNGLLDSCNAHDNNPAVYRFLQSQGLRHQYQPEATQQCLERIINASETLLPDPSYSPGLTPL